jgi:hypothetical protein
LRRVASVAALAGSLLTRIGWILAGRTSAEARVTLRSRSETAGISKAIEQTEGTTTEQAEIAE